MPEKETKNPMWMDDPYEKDAKFILHNIIFLVIGSVFSGRILVIIL